MKDIGLLTEMLKDIKSTKNTIKDIEFPMELTSTNEAHNEEY